MGVVVAEPRAPAADAPRMRACRPSRPQRRQCAHEPARGRVRGSPAGPCRESFGYASRGPGATGDASSSAFLTVGGVAFGVR
jgi:hypothetical protein